MCLTSLSFAPYRIIPTLEETQTKEIIGEVVEKARIDTLKQFGIQHKIDWRILYAIAQNESNGYGLEGELIKHRFEEHIYAGFVKVKLGTFKKHPSLPGLDPEWIKSHSYKELRLMSTSWGMFQIMGWHYNMLGHASVESMVDNYKGSEDYQVRDFLIFCMIYRDGKFYQYLKKSWLRSIANAYNGAGWRKNNYVSKLIKHIRNAPNA